MSNFPPVGELREKYRELLENEDITAVSNWTLPNEDTPTDEGVYLENVRENAPDILATIDKAIGQIKP